MRFAAAELLILKLTGVVCAIIAMLIWVKGIEFELFPYTLIICFSVFFIGLGQFYRTIRVHEPIAATSTVVGISILNGQSCATLTYVFTPYAWQGFDQQLAAIDKTLGFVWSDFVVWAFQVGVPMDALSAVYNSSFYQTLTVVLVLGITARIKELHSYFLGMTIGLIVCIMIWGLFPSSTPVAFQSVPEDIIGQLKLTVSPTIGAELRHIAIEGMQTLPPKHVHGMIGFPSYHTVMLIVTIYGIRHIRFLFPLFLIWNIGMIPAILIQGAHNLIDVFAGAAVAILSIVMTSKWMNQADATKIFELQAAKENPAIPIQAKN